MRVTVSEHQRPAVTHAIDDQSINITRAARVECEVVEASRKTIMRSTALIGRPLDHDVRRFEFPASPMFPRLEQLVAELAQEPPPRSFRDVEIWYPEFNMVQLASL